MVTRKYSVWITALSLAALAGWSTWYGLTRQGTAGLGRPPAAGKTPTADSEGIVNRNPTSTVALDGDVSLRYATALQENNCETVIDLTWWMQERLAQVGRETPSELKAERDRLCRIVTERLTERNRLTPEGVGDQYVFSPGSEVEAWAQDEGRDDLEKTVSHRIWLRVTYPSPTRALLDEKGRPLHSVIAGVNISPDGYILKANIEGNLDFDWQSFSYDW